LYLVCCPLAGACWEQAARPLESDYEQRLKYLVESRGVKNVEALLTECSKYLRKQMIGYRMNLDTPSKGNVSIPEICIRPAVEYVFSKQYSD
jgi:hypothetical protein